MYESIDKKQAAAMADQARVDDLIGPLEKAAVISRSCADLVREKMAELFEAAEAIRGPGDEDGWRKLTTRR